MEHTLELGLDTFGDVTANAAGELISHAEQIRNVVAEAKLADEVGVSFIGVGEHHRADFAVTTPETVLAGIATVTKQIKLGSAVTVLSSDDPIRVYERFATIDALSNGRAEVILGRGSFTESFPLFGFELADYEVLFEEKIALFAELVKEGKTNWQGTTRTPLVDVEVYPKTESGRIPVWVGVGGSPQSVIRAAHYGFDLMLAIIGGSPAQFAPFSKLYGDALEKFGKPMGRVGAHSPGHIAETDEQAREELWPHWQKYVTAIGRERGWGVATRAQFEDGISEHGALYVGSPETVAKKIAKNVKLLGLDRFDLKYSNGELPHSSSMKAIELYGTKVIPMVHDLLS
ncbi:MAG: LLM class flavin-dependent oxidoreductase [Microbacteriaceae bacterium]